MSENYTHNNNQDNSINRLDTLPKLSSSAINITTPENKTYTGPMSGYYPGTFSFEDEIGQIGYEISIMDNYYAASSCYADVISDLGGHNDVLHLRDGTSGGSVWFENIFEVEQSNGSIEFWIRTTDASLGTELRLYDDTYTVGNQAGQFKIGFDTFQVRNGSSWVELTDPIPQDNMWYHISLHFESSMGGYMGLSQYTYSIEIDGDNVGTFDYIYTPMNIRVIHFTTGYTNTNFDSYIDAVGYSWDPSYSTGDNFDEGLLLSFDTGFTPDWLGYSLDNQINKTILGNSTIPFPVKDGIHTIQLFGNSSGGFIYKSIVRYFTTYDYPKISIISPGFHEFSGITAPNFILSIIEPNIDTSWYTLDDGTTNYTFSGSTGQINQTEWEKFSNGSVTIKFYANDTYGLEGYDEVTLWKDTLSPSSAIHFIPHSGIDVVNETTEFTFTADDTDGAGVSIITYKINDSSWITYSSPFTLASYQYGDLLITYQAVDNVDNYEPEQQLLITRTDTIAPNSMISYTPHEAPNTVIPTIIFTISALDDTYGSGVALIRYKIGDSNWITYTAPFNLEGYDYDSYIITYQAIDIAGNIESEDIINVILVPVPVPSGIPGFDIFIIIGAISVISAIVMKKKLKN
jgi:hypothetical protein